MPPSFRRFIAALLALLLAGCGTFELGVEQTAPAQSAAASLGDEPPAAATDTVSSPPTDAPTERPAEPEVYPTPLPPSPWPTPPAPTPTSTPPPPPTPSPAPAGDTAASWLRFENRYYGISFSYPPCYGRLALIESDQPGDIVFRSPVHDPDCSLDHLSLRITPIADYRHGFPLAPERYDPQQQAWFRGDERLDPPTIRGEGWIGYRLAFGDAGLSSEALAIPVASHGWMLSLGVSSRDPQLSASAAPLREAIVATLDVRPPEQIRLPQSEISIDQPARVWATDEPRELWRSPVGDARVEERPVLRGGELALALETSGAAVRVRTAEGVEGWLLAPPGEALTADLAARGGQQLPQTQLTGRVVLPGGLPLRSEPRSGAEPLGAPIPEGTEGFVGAQSGDWVTFQFEDAGGFRLGWVRWYYDRQTYLETRPK